MPTTLTVEPAARVAVTVDSMPTATFVQRVQVKVDDYLQQCTTQPVLQPAGCPFGIEVDDRVVERARVDHGDEPRGHAHPR